MVEHVGAANIDAYARRLASLLAPGGRLLNQGIARLRHGDPEAGAFSERYVFPDAAPLHLSRVLAALEAAGLETVQLRGLQHDYAETLRHWSRRLDDTLDESIKLAGAERVRVWRLYLRAARRGVRDRVHVCLPGAVHLFLTASPSRRHPCSACELANSRTRAPERRGATGARRIRVY